MQVFGLQTSLLHLGSVNCSSLFDAVQQYISYIMWIIPVTIFPWKYHYYKSYLQNKVLPHIKSLVCSRGEGWEGGTLMTADERLRYKNRIQLGKKTPQKI